MSWAQRPKKWSVIAFYNTKCIDPGVLVSNNTVFKSVLFNTRIAKPLILPLRFGDDLWNIFKVVKLQCERFGLRAEPPIRRASQPILGLRKLWGTLTAKLFRESWNTSLRRFPGVMEGLGGSGELVGTIFHLCWYLSEAVVTNYGHTYMGGCPSTVAPEEHRS